MKHIFLLSALVLCQLHPTKSLASGYPYEVVGQASLSEHANSVDACDNAQIDSWNRAQDLCRREGKGSMGNRTTYACYTHGTLVEVRTRFTCREQSPEDRSIQSRIVKCPSMQFAMKLEVVYRNCFNDEEKCYPPSRADHKSCMKKCVDAEVPGGYRYIKTCAEITGQ